MLSRISIKNFSKKLVILLASLLCTQAYASHESAKGVEIFKCHLDFCVQLKTEKLYKSALGAMYAFGPSDLKVIQDGKVQNYKFDGFEGSFDANAGRFYISKESSSFDYVIDTKDQQIYRFPRS